jgi:hypothetical protein
MNEKQSHADTTPAHLRWVPDRLFLFFSFSLEGARRGFCFGAVEMQCRKTGKAIHFYLYFYVIHILIYLPNALKVGREERPGNLLTSILLLFT